MKILFYIFSYLFLIVNNLYAEKLSLKWSITVTILDAIKLIDGGEYKVNKAEGSWEDSKGYYGYLKCLGPLSVNANKNLNLNLICDGFDNKGDKFQINLKRNSVENAGIGRAIYINGTGRYVRFINKECTYAVNYLNSKTGFYKHKCNLSKGN